MLIHSTITKKEFAHNFLWKNNYNGGLKYSNNKLLKSRLRKV